MSANHLTPDLIRGALRRAMCHLRMCVNEAALNGMWAPEMSMPNWCQGQISMIWVFFCSDTLLPQDLRDDIYRTYTEANWLMSGKYPEKQPCAWPN
jgi:hypothetical protein